MFKVAALYHFLKIDHIDTFKNFLDSNCKKMEIFGALIIAHEGINGTISGSHQNIDSIISAIVEFDIRFCDMEIKYSENSQNPFYRMRLIVKDEIVKMGIKSLDPSRDRGEYVSPEKWNELISTDDTILIDTRNDYEFNIGTFQGAINPNTTVFSEFPIYSENNLSNFKDKKIAMFCTGGIRCEKATAFLKSQGFQHVYHLQGGILKYLEVVPPEQSLWNGECYVFDQRVSVKHGLQKGTYSQCHNCRHTLSEVDLQHEAYVYGIQCSYCSDEITEKRRRANAERQLQMSLASENHVRHLGYKKPTHKSTINNATTSIENVDACNNDINKI